MKLGMYNPAFYIVYIKEGYCDCEPAHPPPHPHPIPTPTPLINDGVRYGSPPNAV